jgi:hypothetical protein
MENLDGGTIIGLLAVVVFVGVVIWKFTHRNGSSGTRSARSSKRPGDRDQDLR